jgi:hypothetical protein
MPIARRHQLNGSAPASSLATNIAAHFECISTPCPSDGKIYPQPRPKHSVSHRISVRLRREEQARQRRELAIELFGYLPPDTKGVE